MATHSLLAQRQALRATIWEGGVPPTHSTPLLVAPTNVSGMTRIVWNVSEPSLPMDATVFHYVRSGKTTSNNARGADCAILSHIGHDWTLCRAPSCGAARDCAAPGCAWWDNEEVHERRGERPHTLLPPALICRTLTPASAAGTSRLPRPPAPHLPPALIKPSKVARTLDGAIRRPQQRATRPAGRSTLPPCEPVAPGLLAPLPATHRPPPKQMRCVPLSP